MLRSFLNFDDFLFPKLVTIIYWVGLVLIALFAIIGALGSLAAGNYGGGGLGFLVALIGGVISIVVWRITMELAIVLFSIQDILKSIRDQNR